MAVLPELEGKDTSSLRSIPCGGSAVPKSLSEAYREQLGLPILQAWGMTETSPIASVCQLDSDQRELPVEEQAELRTQVGRISFGVDARVVDPETLEAIAWDGVSVANCSAAATGSLRTTTTTHAAARASPMTVGSRPVTSLRSTPAAGSASSTARRI